MLDNPTKKRIDDCRDVLVGKLPDPKSQIEQITIALIYKFMDDMDKEAIDLGGTAKFFSGDFEQYSWDSLFDTRVTANDMLKLYSQAIESMEKNPNIPQLFRDIFKNAYLPYRDPETLKLFLKTIGEFEYTHSEKLGDAFEYLLSVMGSQGDAGQFRTPRHIIDFLVEAVDPGKTDTILDPACGTAGFLISAFKRIKEKNNNQLTPDERKKLIKNFIGYDISPDMVRLSLVNLYLHGFSNPHIYEYDTLTSEQLWDDNYDVILANPPFMSPKGGIRPHKKFTVSSNRSEVLFVDYIAEHLNPKGRAGIIVPEGVIFQSGKAYKELRKLLVENHLYAVVSLPAGVFNPYSGVKTSILLMDKAIAKKSDKVLFVKIDNDGHNLGAQRNEIKGSHLPEAIEVLNSFKASVENNTDFENTGLAHAVEKKKIAENGEYNLSSQAYSIIELDSSYEFVNLGTICENYDGKRVPITKSDRKEGPYPYYGASGIVDYVNDFLFDEDLLLVSEDGANLLARVTPIAFSVCGKIWVNNHAHVLKFDNQYTRKFIEYILNSMNLEKYISGSAQPKLNQKALNSIQIPLPPLSIQEEIVTEIEGYQKIIDGAKMVVENYKPQIDIDPDWEMVELGEVCEVIMGQSPPGDSYNIDGIGIPLINGPVEFGPEPFSKTIKRQYTTAPTKMCKEGDLMLCVRGSTTGRINISGFEACIGRGVASIRSKMYQGWVNQYINIIREKLYSLGSGSTFPNITSTTLKSLKVPIPPQEIQNQIVSQIEKEQEMVNSSKQLIEIFEQKIRDRIAKVWGG